MQQNANMIKLQCQNGFYEEYVLDKEETGNVLPGSVVSIRPTTEVQADGVTTAVVSSQYNPTYEIDDVETLIVIENALLGKTVNHKSNPGETILLHRPVSGDRLLVRCVPGSYEDSDPLYFVQTPHGIYLGKDDGGVGSDVGTEIKAYAVENYVVPSADDPTRNPKFFYDRVDDSTTERPSSVNMNGAVVNLLRVRIA